jgi:hypothetical protein
VRTAVPLLVALGFVAQGLLEYALRHDMAALRRDDAGGLWLGGVLLSVVPILLALGGAAAAWALHGRGSRWAWPFVLLPLVVLILGFGAGAYLAVYPLPLPGGYGGLPL